MGSRGFESLRSAGPVRRSSESASYLFLLNHTEHEAEVELPPTAELVLGENPLAPLGVAIVREP